MIEVLKGQLSLFNLLFLSLLFCFLLFFLKRIKWFRFSLLLWIIIFLSLSTYFLPSYLAGKLENRFSVFDISTIDSTAEYYILVLAGGYNADQRLPGVGQLEIVSLGRLAEAVRIKRLIPNAFLVCSGYSAYGLTSQAATTRKAAIELGVGNDEILIMETPRTTWEEAQAFVNAFGTEKRVILVTDAIHMKRAVAFFETSGLNVIPAPANFRLKQSVNNNTVKFLPSISNIQLMNYVTHEYAANLKHNLLSTANK